MTTLAEMIDARFEFMKILVMDTVDKYAADADRLNQKPESELSDEDKNILTCFEKISRNTRQMALLDEAAPEGNLIVGQALIFLMEDSYEAAQFIQKVMLKRES